MITWTVSKKILVTYEVAHEVSPNLLNKRHLWLKKQKKSRKIRKIVIFDDPELEAVIDAIEKSNYDGMDKTWVNQLMLSQRKHYAKSLRKPA